jgi:Pyruvate/2-oxoacid:ferredoxin oxidoreductase delta subunit
VSYSREDVLKATHDLTGMTIPVHVTVEGKEVVLSQPEMQALLSSADVIAVGNCLCREEEGNCDHPLDVCIALNDAATEGIQERSWRAISIEEALAVLEKTYDLGLIHLAYRRGDGDISFACSCCSCCCWPLNGLKQFDYHDGITESAFVARHVETKCVGCGICVERCVFEAFELAEGAERATFDSDRCFGCGLCVGTCPNDAITFERRRGPP